jgi:Dyp-type peroxidase family
MLAQRVPEFDSFLTANALTINDPSAPKDLGKELLGARMVGRWKSGAPVELAALQDNPAIGADPQQNNNFNFSKDPDQSRCPFAGHVRKTNPRADLDSVANGLTPHRIIRRGIAFGTEVTKEERDSGTTKQNRGLLFVCYQSNLANGFQFIQKCKRSFISLIRK